MPWYAAALKEASFLLAQAMCCQHPLSMETTTKPKELDARGNGLLYLL